MRNGIQVPALLPLTVAADPRSAAYLLLKRERMGHALPDLRLPSHDRFPVGSSASATGILEYT
ncbi:hypothetical protein ACW9HR_13400 [Nocardia gipuzkoensis]